MTANRERGEVALTVGSTTYVLRLTVSACVALEQKAQRTFGSVLAGVGRRQMEDSIWLLWAALQPYHAEAFPAFEQTAALLDDAGSFGTVLDMLRQTVTELLARNEPPTSSEGEPANPPGAQIGTGDGSTAPPVGTV